MRRSAAGERICSVAGASAGPSRLPSYASIAIGRSDPRSCSRSVASCGVMRASVVGAASKVDRAEVGDPPGGAAARLAPAVSVELALWLDALARRPGRGQLALVAPSAHGEPGEERGAECRRLDDGRDLDDPLPRVGERLHERRVRAHAPVDAQMRDGDARVALGRLDEVDAAVRDAFEDRPHELRTAGTACEPEEGAAGAVVPRRGAYAEQGGHVPG